MMSRVAPPGQPQPAPWAVAHAPSSHDPLLGPLTEVAGGPAGRHCAAARPSKGWSWGARSVLVIVIQIPIALAVLISQPCRSTGWSSPGQFTHACYSDIPVALGDNAVPLPAAMTLFAEVARVAAAPLAATLGRPADAAALLRTGVDLLTLLVSAAACLLVLAAIRLAGHRPWDAAMIAASPVLVTASLVSLDLVAVALFIAGLAVFTWPPSLAGPRSAPLTVAVLSGVLFGAAIAVRPIAIIGPLVLVLLATRAGQWSPTGAAVASAGATWAVLNLPSFIASPATWWQYPRGLVSADPGYGSVWIVPGLFDAGTDVPLLELPAAFALAGAVALVALLVVRQLLPVRIRKEWLPLRESGFSAAAAVLVLTPAVFVLAGPWLLRLVIEHPAPAGATRWVAIMGGLAVLGTVGLFTLTTHRRPRAPAIALMLMVGWWLVAPSLPVQAGVWVLPLLALAVPSWRVLLVWGGVESAYAVLTWLYLYGLSVADRGLPASWYTLAILLRIVAWVWVAALAWRTSVHPHLDPVRNRPDARGEQRDDPSGGPFDETGDAVLR